MENNPEDSNQVPQTPEPQVYNNIVDFVYDPKGTGDLDIEVAIREDGKVAIFHDKPFKRELSWIEYDMQAGQLHFIMENGDLRIMGLSVRPELKKNMQNTHQILMVLMDTETGQAKEGGYIPLIIHQL
ncbi:MAG: hypothetical protein LRY62_00350 [Alphaproteobacteria bacterium]|nr:hypothetical protein [Alphaproteobacteria bacterium]